MLLAANLAVFIVCAAVAFARNANALFYSFDGAYRLVDMRNQLQSAHQLLIFSSDFLQSAGDLQFLQNARLLFFFWPLGWFSDLTLAKVATYLIIAVLVFLSTYVLARGLSQSQNVALAAAWVLGACSMPFVPIPFFYPILSVAPPSVLLVAVPVVFFRVLLSTGRRNILLDVFYTVLLVALALYFLAANPLSTVVLAPATACYALIALLRAENARECARKAGALVAVLGIAIALRWPWYLYGLYADTAPQFFPNDFTVVYQTPVYVSILFQGLVYGWAGPALVCAAAIGALIALRRPGTELESAAFVTLASITVLVGMRVALALLPHWILPPPVYFEICLWPLYALFAAVALQAALRRIWSPPAWVLPVGAALVLALLAALRAPTAMDYTFPPSSNALIEILRANITLGAASPFNGRVATIIPVNLGGLDPWNQQIEASLGLARVTGNDSQSVGLWYYRVPTLFEYNAVMAPVFHALVERALQQPAVAHDRNVTIFTFPNARVLTLLGVRYVISPQGTLSIGTLRETERVPPTTWELRELRAPNLATYSPTEVEVRQSLSSALDFIADESVDLTKSAVLQKTISGPLVPLRASSLSMAGSYLHITAQSSGRTLVVVPYEFSRCIELHSLVPSNTPTAELMRVDADLTGVLFEHKLDALLEYRTGPLRNPMCRWQDVQDIKALINPA